MAGSTIPAWIQAGGALVMAVGLVTTTYHKYVIDPIGVEAEAAMSEAGEALELAESNREDLDRLDSDLRESLDDLSESVNDLVAGMERQQRESRGRSYQLYVLAKAINESDEAPDVPVPDEDEFLRGGGEFEDPGDD